MAPQQATAIARQRGLDLVEVSPTAVPPVCRITDYGKYQYTEQKRARQARKHQKTIEVKEIKFRPKVDMHDYDFKKNHIVRFLAEGDKFKATIFFRGREIAHPEIGRRILERLIQEISDIAVPENMPRMEGNSMHVILGPKAGGSPPKKPAPQAQQRQAPAPQAQQRQPSAPAAAAAGAGAAPPPPPAEPPPPPAAAARGETRQPSSGSSDVP